MRCFGSAQARRAQGGEPAQDWRIVKKEVEERERERAAENPHREGMESEGRGACAVQIEGEREEREE
eukprot:954808-Rhodomonas_salina.1